MKLTDREWKVFSLTGVSGLFPIKATSTGIDAINLKNGAGDRILPYITRTESNNGISDFISSDNNCFGMDSGNCITIGLDTQTAYWQPFAFITGQNIHVLRSEKLNYYSSHFITVILRNQMKSKFNWGGNGATLGRLKKLRILLPANTFGEPDFKFMEDYTKELIEKKKAQYRSYAENMIKSIDEALDLGSKKWHSFVISEIFEIKPGKRLVAADSTEGERPFIGALDNNNGVARFVSDDNVSKDKNVLGVNYNGNGMVIGFYHPYECIFSDDVKRFHLKHYPDNEYVLLFMKALILKQKSKFGYLYKFNADRMVHTSIMIPVDDNGNPDYVFMEQYGKKLVARKYQQYLDYLDSRKNI